MHALVLADGDRPRREELDRAWPGWDDGVALVVAADGGARLADDLGVDIHLWVGDGDSLPPDAVARLERKGVEMLRAPVDKDESDTELAVLAAAASCPVRLVDETTSARLVAAPGPGGGAVTLDLPGPPGRLVSLLPWGGRVEGVTTDGFRYALADEPLEMGPARGLSNVRDDASARVTVRSGRLLVVESAATLGR